MKNGVSARWKLKRCQKQRHSKQRSCKVKTPTGVKGWQKKEIQALRARHVDKEEERVHRNISFMLKFLSDANIYTLRNMGNDNQQKLQRLLEAYYDDEIFDAEFPREKFDSFLRDDGKMLQSTDDGDRRGYFRQQTLRLCAGKLYDMLMGSSFRKNLGTSYGRGPAIYDVLFETAIKVAHPEKYDRSYRHIAGMYNESVQTASA